jgi:hypothetical protein
VILPDALTVCRALDVTWPAATKLSVPGFTIREGKGGGQRVSAATTVGPFEASQIGPAEDAMYAIGQTPLFMIQPGDDALATHLDKQGYIKKDATLLYAISTAKIAGIRPPPVTSFQVWPPLAAQREIWAQGGTGTARLAVMDRAACPKTSFLGRVNDRPAASAFAGIAHGCTMLHSLEVAKVDRRQGLAANLTRASAIWGQIHGAQWFTLAAVEANTGANALYTSLGMQVVGQYHYRIKPD